MALHPRSVAGSAVAIFLAGLALWPPRAVYRENKASASGLDPEGEADT